MISTQKLNENKLQNKTYRYLPKNINYSTQQDINLVYKTPEEYLMESLHKFYKKQKNINKMNNYLDNYRVSVLDWFLTNYSKKYNIYYNITKCKKKQLIFVHTAYKTYLKPYKKEYFDPFCRGKKDKKFNLTYTDADDNEQQITTTIARLHAFKWCIKNLVLDYVVKYYDKIHEDLCEHNRNKRDIKKEKKEKKK